MALKSGRKSGFTLIELLVVIAIIAILAAILFPVFARARENARRASCQSQLKQIGLGVLQYSQDYDERYPMRWTGTAYPGYGASSYVANTWVDAIQPYVKSTQVFICPSGPKSGNGSGRQSDYAYNGNLLGSCSNQNPCVPYSVKLSEIVSPSTQIMSGDAMWAVVDNPGAQWMPSAATFWDKPNKWYEWSGGNPDDKTTNMAFPQEISGPTVGRSWNTNGFGYFALAQRHLETANVLYCDGHVKARNVAQVYSHLCGDPQNEWCNGKASP